MRGPGIPLRSGGRSKQPSLGKARGERAGSSDDEARYPPGGRGGNEVRSIVGVDALARFALCRFECGVPERAFRLDCADAEGEDEGVEELAGIEEPEDPVPVENVRVRHEDPPDSRTDTSQVRDGVRKGVKDVPPGASPYVVCEARQARPFLARAKELGRGQAPSVERDFEVTEKHRTEAPGRCAGRLRDAVARDLVVEIDEDLAEVYEDRARHGLMAWAGIR